VYTKIRGEHEKHFHSVAFFSVFREGLGGDDSEKREAERIWPGMFQAKAGRGNTTSVRSTRDAISDTVASYAISDEQGARKNALDNRRRTAVNRADMGIKAVVVFLVGLALASVRFAEAQQTKKVPRIGFQASSGDPSSPGY
jgi:hypothetical protein